MGGADDDYMPPDGDDDYNPDDDDWKPDDDDWYPDDDDWKPDEDDYIPDDDDYNPDGDDKDDGEYDPDEYYKELFARADKDKNGKLSKREYTTIQQGWCEGCEAGEIEEYVNMDFEYGDK